MEYDEIYFKSACRGLTGIECARQEAQIWGPKDVASQKTGAAKPTATASGLLQAWEALISVVSGFGGRTADDKRACGASGGPGRKF